MIKDRLRRLLFAKQLEALHLGKLTYNLREIGFERPVFPDGSAASAGLLYTLLRVLWQARPVSILELGSGLTTELINHYLRTANPAAQATSIENNPAWHERVGAKLGSERHRYLLRTLVGTPHFYDWSEVTGPFDLVIVDGPARDRRGAIERLPPVLGPEFVLIIDDAHKPDSLSGLAFARTLRAALTTPADDGIIHGEKDQMLVTSPRFGWLLGRAGD